MMDDSDKTCPTGKHLSKPECSSNEAMAYIKSIAAHGNKFFKVDYSVQHSKTGSYSKTAELSFQIEDSVSSSTRNYGCAADKDGRLRFNSDKSGKNRDSIERSLCKSG